MGGADVSARVASTPDRAKPVNRIIPRAPRGNDPAGPRSDRADRHRDPVDQAGVAALAGLDLPAQERAEIGAQCHDPRGGLVEPVLRDPPGAHGIGQRGREPGTLIPNVDGSAGSTYSSRSDPAATARIAFSPASAYSASPLCCSMSMSSVTTTPSKPSSSLRMRCHTGDSEAAWDRRRGRRGDPSSRGRRPRRRRRGTGARRRTAIRRA